MVKNRFFKNNSDEKNGLAKIDRRTWQLISNVRCLRLGPRPIGKDAREKATRHKETVK